MKITISLLFAVSVFALATASDAAAATVPAGTRLVVRTLNTITSSDATGTRLHTELMGNITVQGRVVLPAGTKINGRVESSRRLASSKDRLSVDLTEVIIGGRSHPLRTTGPVHPVNFTTSRGVAVTRGFYTFARGKTITFHLGQPLTF